MAKATAQPPKGTRDFLPLDVRRRDHVTGIIRQVYESYGFEPLETPALERLDTLMGKYGEEGDQLLFKVLLRGQPLVKGLHRAGEHVADEANLVQGRSGVTAPGAEPMLSDMGLRYDLTVPLARVCASYQGKLPTIFKRYQIQPVWRADTPGKGRFREFYQCDVDVVGGDSLVVEAEVLSAGAECLQRLGFDDFVIRLNHRALLRALIEHAGIPLSLETEAIVAVDKMDKVGRDGVDKELEQRGIEPAARQRLLALLGDDASLEHIEKSLADHEGGRAAVADLKQLLSLAGALPAGRHLQFDVTLARGLSYYTGCIFEVQVKDLAGSIGSGGRYDGLIGMFSGRDAPACGFSLGLERILVVMAERDMFPDSLTHVDLMVAAADPTRLPEALSLAAELRAGGLRVDLRPKTIKPGKLRQQAEALGLAGAVWLEGEADSGPRLWLRHGETARDVTAAGILERVQESRASEAGGK
jgi:histidyl-tRNA synthetase